MLLLSESFCTHHFEVKQREPLSLPGLSATPLSAECCAAGESARGKLSSILTRVCNSAAAQVSSSVGPSWRVKSGELWNFQMNRATSQINTTSDGTFVCHCNKNSTADRQTLTCVKILTGFWVPSYFKVVLLSCIKRTQLLYSTQDPLVARTAWNMLPNNNKKKQSRKKKKTQNSCWLYCRSVRPCN